MDHTGRQERSATISTYEWNRYRQTIVDLYKGQNMSLPRLMHYMSSHYNFDATTKMYKYRFSVWGVEKNSNAARVLARTGRTTPHGSDFSKVRDYLHRLPEQRRRGILESLDPSLGYSRVALPAVVSPPDEVLFPERCIREMRSYVFQCHETGLWPRDDVHGFRLEDVVPAWCSSPWQAVSLLKEGRTDKANRLLTRFAAEGGRQLQRNDPLLFPFIYTSILYFCGRFPPYAATLLAFLDREARAVLQGDLAHPIQSLIETLAHIGPENMVHFGSRILLAYIDHVRESLGAAWPIVLELLADVLDRLVFYTMMEPHEALEVGYRTVLDAELHNHGRSQSSLELRMSLSHCYLRMARYAEGRRVLQDILAVHDPRMHSNKMLVGLHMQMSRLYDGEGDLSAALESAVRAVQTSIQEFGEVAGWTISSLRLLREMQEKAGDTEQAQKVMQDYDYLIGRMCT